ncbi:hypothetical protein ACFYOC_24060 [Nocardiopsis alba]|uniref:hypothetical protein n=1 Tax=Nocardiopsis alba TaxID=53437 RepID=UPI0036C98E89
MITLTKTQCGYCYREDHLFLCSECKEEVREILSGVRWMADNLTVALCRQDELSRDTGSPSGGTHQPLVYSERASDALSRLRQVMEHYGAPLLDGEPTEAQREGRVSPMSWALLIDSDLDRRAAHDPSAGKLLEDLQEVKEQALRAIDAPEAQVFAGHCPDCSTALYASKAVQAVVCEHCDSVALVVVSQGQEDLLRAAEDMRLSLREAVRVLQLAGYSEVNKDLLHRWEKKGLKDGNQRLYLTATEEGVRIGDAIDMLEFRRSKSATAQST